MTYTLYLSQLLVSHTLAELLYIHTIRAVPHTLLPSVHRSTQFLWFIMTGYPLISSHPLPTLLRPEPLFLQNSRQTPGVARRRGDDGLSACWLHRFTTSLSSELRDALRVHHWVSLEMHLEVVMVGVGRYTWGPWSCEVGDTLKGCDRASLESHSYTMIDWVWRCTWRR